MNYFIFCKVLRNVFLGEVGKLTILCGLGVAPLWVFWLKGKVKWCTYSSSWKSPHRYGISHAIWDHTVLSATRQWCFPAFTPAKAGTQFSDLGGIMAEHQWGKICIDTWSLHRTSFICWRSTQPGVGPINAEHQLRVPWLVPSSWTLCGILTFCCMECYHSILHLE